MTYRPYQQILGRVEHIDPVENRAYIFLRNGAHTTELTADRDDLAVGTTVLFDPQDGEILVAPPELWKPEPWTGIVRLVETDRVVVAAGDRFRIVPVPDLAVGVGYTVQGVEDRITEVIADRPIKQYEISVGDPPVDLTPFKFEPSPSPRIEDFGGNMEAAERAFELIDVPLQHHEALRKIGARPIKGVLFTGPSGTGKTMLGKIIANQAKATFYQIRGPEIIGKYLGESEGLLRQIFDNAKANEPAIIFFDEIDSIAPRRDRDVHEASRRLVGMFLTLMDGFDKDKNIIVIATTNRKEDIDPALLRPGRFDWQIQFELPTVAEREDILKKSANELTVSDDLPHDVIAAKTNGWSPAELVAIWSDAALLAVKDGREVILAEDYFGGYERARDQQARAEAIRHLEGKAVRRR